MHIRGEQAIGARQVLQKNFGFDDLREGQQAVIDRSGRYAAYDLDTGRAYYHSHTRFPADSADAFCDAHPQLMTRHALRL